MKSKSFKKVLITYFILFTILIFVIIFLFQKLLFSRLTNFMIKNNANSIKEKIVVKIDDEDISEVIDAYAHNESLLIYIIDNEKNVLYSSDSYKNNYNKVTSSENNNPYLKDKTLSYMKGNYRDLPENYDVFLDGLSDNKEISFEDGKQYVLGCRLTDSKEYYNSILYLKAPLSVTGGIVSALNIQLTLSMIISFFISFFISYYISNKFNAPIKMLALKSNSLGNDNYEPIKIDNFCNELNELSYTLDMANEKLMNNKNYQNELLSNVSHDLRTPLTVIKGYAEMIKDVDIKNEEDVVNDASLIISESDRLNEMVNDILEYSKLQLADYKNSFENVNISEKTDDVIRKLKILANEKNIDVIKSFGNDIYVFGISDLIERMIFNLVDNAIQYAKSKVIIDIVVDDSIKLEVIDDGKGIDENDIDYVFDKYFTKRIKKEKSVSGIGLSIVKQIAIIHNAKYGVESEKGAGSKFYIHFNKKVKIMEEKK